MLVSPTFSQALRCWNDSTRCLRAEPQQSPLPPACLPDPPLKKLPPCLKTPHLPCDTCCFEGLSDSCTQAQLPA